MKKAKKKSIKKMASAPKKKTAPGKKKVKKVKNVVYKKRVKDLPEKLINNFLERLAAI